MWNTYVTAYEAVVPYGQRICSASVQAQQLYLIYIGIETFLTLIEDLIVLLFELRNNRLLTIKIYFVFRE